MYKASSSLDVGGSLTLDAGGDPNAVFIFQAPSTLITDSASSVVLTNGAQACNVFWQVGSSATLGTNSTFTGTILALTSISVKTGDTIAGRALARNGSVTLDDDTITAPSCSTTTPTPTPTATTPTPTPTATTPTPTPTHDARDADRRRATTPTPTPTATTPTPTPTATTPTPTPTATTPDADADRDDPDADADRDDPDADADATTRRRLRRPRRRRREGGRRRLGDRDDADADRNDADAEGHHADAHRHEPEPDADQPHAPPSAYSYTRRQHLPGDRLSIAPPRGRPAQPGCAGLPFAVRAAWGQISPVKSARRPPNAR